MDELPEQTSRQTVVTFAREGWTGRLGSDQMLALVEFAPQTNCCEVRFQPVHMSAHVV